MELREGLAAEDVADYLAWLDKRFAELMARQRAEGGTANGVASFGRRGLAEDGIGRYENGCPAMVIDPVRESFEHRLSVVAAVDDEACDKIEDRDFFSIFALLFLPELTPHGVERLYAIYGSIGAILKADGKSLAEISDLARAPFEKLSALKRLVDRVNKEKIRDRPLLDSFASVVEYLSVAMRHGTEEQARVLFLDRKNYLIAEEVVARGTVDHTPLYPREVVKRALLRVASSVVLVHNHLSPDPTPSRADIEMTKLIANALSSVDIALHDHIIISRGASLSFRTANLL